MTTLEVFFPDDEKGKDKLGKVKYLLSALECLNRKYLLAVNNNVDMRKPQRKWAENGFKISE